MLPIHNRDLQLFDRGLTILNIVVHTEPELRTISNFILDYFPNKLSVLLNQTVNIDSRLT